MMVEAGLAERDNLWVPGQLAQRWRDVIGCFESRRWMPADDRKHGGELFGQFDSPSAALEIGADADDTGNARRFGPGDHVRQLICEIGIIEMRVRIEKERHVGLELNNGYPPPPPAPPILLNTCCMPVLTP